MACTAIPIEQRPFRRWQAMEPSDTTVYDPPPDAILVIGSSNRGTIAIVGADDVSVIFSLGSGPTEIIPLATKKVLNTGTSSLAGYPVGLWRD